MPDAQTGRCFGDNDPQYASYHDTEWGRPLTDERRLFECLCLEGMQAGLSWLVILRRREHLHRAYAGFDPHVLADWVEDDVERLLEDPGVIRHRKKIEAVISNARALLALHAAGTSLGRLVWTFCPDPRPAPVTRDDVPAQTDASKALARELTRQGFRFVGPTTVYAFMQAAGIVNDHLATCPVREACELERDGLDPKRLGDELV